MSFYLDPSSLRPILPRIYIGHVMDESALQFRGRDLETSEFEPNESGHISEPSRCVWP